MPRPSIFKSMIDSLINESLDMKRIKNKSIVLKKVKSYYYEYYMNAQGYINKIFLDDERLGSSPHNIEKLTRFIKTYDSVVFGFIEYNNDYIGFTNGILNLHTLEFINEADVPSDIIVKNYIPYDFIHSTETPLIDKMLDYQFSAEVREFIYACIGRVFKRRDDQRFIIYMYGMTASGKNVLINVIRRCFKELELINESYVRTKKSNYSSNNDIILSDRPPKNMETQSRPMVLHFKKMVPSKDINSWLENDIISTELPAFIYKCLLNYNNMIVSKNNESIWDICPKYFK